MTNNLKILRKSKQETQSIVAKNNNLSQALYSFYEKGGNMPIETILKLADYFGCSIDYLLDHKTEAGFQMLNFSPVQQKTIELMKQMNTDQSQQLFNYAAFLVGQTLSQLAPNRPW